MIKMAIEWNLFIGKNGKLHNRPNDYEVEEWRDSG